MKKLFLLALTILLVCNAIYAEDPPATNEGSAKLELQLDLRGKNSIVKVGFISDAPSSTNAISANGVDSMDEAGSIDVIADGTNELTTGETPFHFYWYINSVKKADGSNGTKLSLKFTNLYPTGDNIIDANSRLGYTLKFSKILDDASDNPIIGELAEANVTDAANAFNEVDMIDVDDFSGLNRGVMKISIQPIDFSGKAAQQYLGIMTLTISAP